MNFGSLTIANGEADLDLLNKACTMFSTRSGSNEECENINQILIKFCERPDSFNFCFPIINGEFHTYTKFLAYQIVKKTILDKWNSFTDDDKTVIRNQILISIVKMVKEGQKYFTVSMANQSLIEVLKCDWPERWPSFIEELILTCQNEGIQFLKNGLDILKMLADEVSANLPMSTPSPSNHITRDRARAMQAGFVKEFLTIYSLIESAFNLATTSGELNPIDISEIDTKALNAFSSFIPVVRSDQLLESPFVSNVAPLIQDNRFVFSVFSIFGKFCEYISQTDTDNTTAAQFEKSLLSVFQMSIQQIYSIYGDAINFNCVKYDDILVLVRCVYEFLHLFIPILETTDYQAEINIAIQWIIQTSISDYIDNKDDLSLFSEVIKFWHFFAMMLYRSASQDSSQFQETYSSSLSHVIPFLVKNIVSPYTVYEISTSSGNRFQNYLSSNSYESSLYETMKETFVILYGLKKDDLSNGISLQVNRLRQNQYDCDTINSICWTVGSIAKAASDNENSDLMGTIIPILVNLIEAENATNDPTFEEIKKTASTGLLFLCSQEAKYFQNNPEFLKSLVQIIIRLLTSDSSILNIVAIHTLNLLSKSCKKAFIIPIKPSNSTIINDILSVFTDTVMRIRPENRGSFVSIIADIVRLDQSKSADGSYVQSFNGFLDQVSTIFNQTCAEIEIFLSQFQSIHSLAMEGINNFGNPDGFTLSLEYPFQDPNLPSIDNLKLLISSINILNAMPSSMHNQFLPFFETIWPRLIDVYEFATNNSNKIVTTDFDQGYDPQIVHLAHSSLDLYNEISNSIAELFKNTLVVTKQDQPQFLQVITSSFFLGANYHSLNPQSYPPNILSMYGSLFQNSFNFDFDDEGLRIIMVKMFLEIFESIFLPTTNVIKDEYDTFYDLRIEMVKLIRGIIRGRPDLIFALNEEQIDIFVNLMMWLSKHPYEEISYNMVESIFIMINSFKTSPRITDKTIVNAFWEKYFCQFISQMLILLSDSTYKFGFEIQTLVLAHLFQLPIAATQFDAIVANFAHVFDKFSNVDFIRDLMAKAASLIEFRSVMRDLLIETKQYSPKDPDLCVLELFKKKRIETLEKERIFGTEQPQLISPEKVEEEMSIVNDIFAVMSI